MRHEIDFVIDKDGGRDAGKNFRIVEMPAIQAELLALRAVSSMVRNGLTLTDFDIDDVNSAEGMRTLAAIGAMAFARIPFDEAFPMLSELLRCVWIVPDPTRTEYKRPLMPEADLEEVDTVTRLRMEVIQLHLDFFKRLVDRLKSTQAKKSPGSPVIQTAPAS